VQGAHGKVVDVDPDGSAPVGRVVLGVALVVETGVAGERAEAKGGPQAVGRLEVGED
jgi:hypothetical protein